MPGVFYYLVSERECRCVLGGVHMDDVKLIPGTEIVGKANEGGGARLGDPVVDHHQAVQVQHASCPVKPPH